MFTNNKTCQILLICLKCVRMATERIITALLMNLHQQEENDDEEAVLAALQAIVFRSRQMRRYRRHPLLLWLLRRHQIRGMMGPINRLAIPNFVDIVWRYPDTQFQEDFRMHRERFEVNIGL